MSSRSRGRGRGYMGRGSYNVPSYQRGRGDERSVYRGGGRGFRGSGGPSEYRSVSRHREPLHSGREHHSSSRNDRRREDMHPRDEYHSRRPRSPPPPSHRKTDQILAKLHPDEQEALTKALVDTVLQKTVSCEQIALSFNVVNWIEPTD